LILAQKVVEALKKLKDPSANKISQEEMIKEAQKSVAKNEKGKYRLVYKKDRRTIVAEPRGWEWEPNPKDICFNKAGHELIVIGINRRKPYVIEVAEVLEDGINLDSYTICPDEIVPFIPWEKIEKIAKKFGFALGQNDFTDRDGVITYGAWFNHMGHWSKFGEGKDRQTTVTSALFELEKELNE